MVWSGIVVLVLAGLLQSTTSTGGTPETQGVHRYIHNTNAHISYIFNVTPIMPRTNDRDTSCLKRSQHNSLKKIIAIQLVFLCLVWIRITFAFLCKSKAYGKKNPSSGSRPARHRWKYFRVLCWQSGGSLVFLVTLSKKKNKRNGGWAKGQELWWETPPKTRLFIMYQVIVASFPCFGYVWFMGSWQLRAIWFG